MHAELEERLRFETLLTKISGRFVNVPADQVDSEIEGAQRRICEFLNLDRSSLWHAHIHQPQGGPPIPERPNGRDLFPWTAQKVLVGETVTITKLSDLPPEAGQDRENYGLYGTKSNVFIPYNLR